MLVKYSHTHFKVINKNVTCIEDRKLKQDYSNLLLVTHHTSREYFRSIWTAVYQFWAHLIKVTKSGKPGEKNCESEHRHFV